MSVMILNKLNCNVTAVTGKKENNDYLTSLGAKNLINSVDLDKEPRVLDKGLYDGAVDTVGGNILANVLPHIRDKGIVAACGNAKHYKLNTPAITFSIFIPLEPLNKILSPAMIFFFKEVIRLSFDL